MKSFPSAEFSAVSVSSNSPVYINESQSLKTIATSTGAQRFEFELTTAWHTMATARALHAFLNAVGQHEKFTVQVPLVDMPQGVAPGNVFVAAAYPVGTSQLRFVGFTAAIGDFVQFVGHSKAYQVVALSGLECVIYPPLLSTVGLNETVNVNNVKFTVRNKGDISTLKSKKNNRAQLKLNVIEAF